MAQPGKVVSAQKQSARSNVEIARATKRARGLEVDAELLELRAKNARLTSDNSALKTEIEELKVQNGLQKGTVFHDNALATSLFFPQSRIFQSVLPASSLNPVPPGSVQSYCRTITMPF